MADYSPLTQISQQLLQNYARRMSPERLEELDQERENQLGAYTNQIAGQQAFPAGFGETYFSSRSTGVNPDRSLAAAAAAMAKGNREQGAMRQLGGVESSKVRYEDAKDLTKEPKLPAIPKASLSAETLRPLYKELYARYIAMADRVVQAGGFKNAEGMSDVNIAVEWARSKVEEDIRRYIQTGEPPKVSDVSTLDAVSVTGPAGAGAPPTADASIALPPSAASGTPSMQVPPEEQTGRDGEALRLRFAELDQLMTQRNATDDPNLRSQLNQQIIALRKDIDGFVKGMNKAGQPPTARPRIEAAIAAPEVRAAAKKSAETTAAEEAKNVLETRNASASLDATLSQMGAMKDFVQSRIGSSPGIDKSTGWAAMVPLVGGTASMPGTDAYQLQADLDTLKYKIGFQTLAAMREASKTGGALGNVSEKEIEALQNSIESLRLGQKDFRQRVEGIVKELERMERVARQSYKARNPNRTPEVQVRDRQRLEELARQRLQGGK